MRYAAIENGAVVNVILWDGESDLEGSADLVPIGSEPVGPGWRRTDGQWIAPAEPEFPAPTVDELRLAAYREEADPLFFKWQRGEATEQEWLDAVEAIRARFPDEPN